MCGSSAPPAPVNAPAPKADPAIAEAAQRQAQLGEDYLSFAKEQFAISSSMQAELNAITKEVSNTFLEMARTDRERYDTVFKPLEDEFIKLAKEYDTPEKQDEAAARAKADVLSAAEQERGAMERRNASIGIRPDSGRYEGIDRAIGLGTSLASVDAQNRAREDVRDKGLALKTAAIDMGRSLPGQAANYMTTGVGIAGQPVATHAASTGIVQPGYSAAITGSKGQADILNTQHKNDLSAWETQSNLDFKNYELQQKMDASNAEGIGKFAGSAMGLLGSSSIGAGGASGLGLLFMSSKKAKTNRKDVPDGESLAAVEKMPIQTYDYKPGMGDGGSHVGPMAEDFAAATGKGDGKTIAAQDAIGIAIGAIKDLSAKVDQVAQAVGLGTRRASKTAMA